MASKGLERLKELALADSFERHPSLPDYVRTIRNYSDKTSNGLCLCILDFLRFSGQQAERVAITGRYLDQSKLIKDTLGFTKRIGSGRWIKPSMQPGSADISATIKNKDGIGVSVKLELKIGRDKMSDLQKQYQAGVERAGGKYWLISDFDTFLKFYDELKD